MGVPRIDQLNVVVPDVLASVAFLGALGVAVPALDAGWEAWAPHHRALPVVDRGLDVELDSSAFARWWGGLPDGFTGVVVEVRVDERSDVDALHERALAHGGTSLKAPHDAFWGARFALVRAPGPMMVGLMSVGDDTHRHTGPDVAEFAG